MNLQNINDNDKPEFIGQIVDIFEDYLEEKKIDIPSEDREIEINSLLERGIYANAQEAIDNEGFARIYGEDYDEISSEVEYGLTSNLDIDELITNIYDGFIRIIRKNPTASVPAADNTALKDKVRETFVNWKLID